MTEEKNKDEVILSRVDKVVNDFKNNDVTYYFFTADCKNTPNGSIAYLYNIAKTLQDNGKKVAMLYQIANEYTQEEIDLLTKEKQELDASRMFVGVGEWLGEAYASIPHYNIAKGELEVSPSDFLFIPEVFASLMSQTDKVNLPCKRIAVVYNYDYIAEFIPFGCEWSSFHITDAIVSTPECETLVKNVFPYVRTSVVTPWIKPTFKYDKETAEPRKLVVNIMSKNQDDINRIIKPFYWKYPTLKFVTFRELRNYPQSEYASLMKETPITIWVDEHTPFGVSALEAMACGNIVIGKIPENIPAWMGGADKLKENGLWVNSLHSIPDILSSVIMAFLRDDDMMTLTPDVAQTVEEYDDTKGTENLLKVFDNITKQRMDEIVQYQTILRGKVNQNNNTEENTTEEK